MKNTTAKQWNNFHKIIIHSKDPLCIIKLGSTESICVSKYLHKTTTKNIDRTDLWLASGVYCSSDSSFEEWCESYIRSIKQTDYVHLWQDFCFSANKSLTQLIKNKLTDSFLIETIKPNLKHPPQSALHDDWLPFSLKEEGWHYSLSDKKVLVVSSAENSFRYQAKFYNKIWPGANLAGFEFVKVPDSEILTGENLNNPLDWKEKLDLVKNKISKKEFDFAMIGCGGIGLMVIDFIKNQMKHSCTYLGGNVQLFFGIRGNRWENSNLEFYNNSQYWVCPFNVDIPQNFRSLENGSYWVKSQ